MDGGSCRSLERILFSIWLRTLSRHSRYVDPSLVRLPYGESRFQCFHKANGALPNDIVVYRNGKSEGEFKAVCIIISLIYYVCFLRSRLKRLSSRRRLPMWLIIIIPLSPSSLYALDPTIASSLRELVSRQHFF